MIYDFVKNIFKADIKPKFIWKFMEDDEDIEEYGEYLQDLVGENITIVEIED